MAEVLELGQTTDEIIANLEYMNTFLSQGSKQLHSFGEDIESRQATLEQSFLLSELELLGQNLQAAEDSFEALTSEATIALSELQQVLVNVHSSLDHFSQFMEEAQNIFEAEIIELNTELEQNVGAIEVSLTDMEESTHQIRDALEDEIEDTRSSFETLDQVLHELESRVGQFTEVSAKFDSLSNDVSSYQGKVESEFEDLNRRLEQEDLDEIRGRIDAAQDTFTQFLKNFEENIKQNAEEKLRDEITELISGYEAVCETDIKPQLEEEFQTPVQDRADDLSSDLERSKELALRANEIARDSEINGVPAVQSAQNTAREIDECLEAQMS